MSSLPLVFLALLLPQTDEFQTRVRIDGGKVIADDQVLYEGPWRKAEVTVADVGGKKAREFFRGPEYETKVERTMSSFTVYLNNEVLYRISRPDRPPPRVEDVVLSINLKRVKAGLGVVRPVPGLSKGCDLHALYLTKNDARGLSAHEEDPRATGYTDEGARA